MISQSKKDSPYNYNFEGVSLAGLEHELSIEKTLKVIYQHINALDQADRRGLSVPLRVLVERMWQGSDSLMPNPFLLRKLEEQVMESWAQFLADSAKPVAAPIYEKSFTLLGGRIGALDDLSCLRIGRVVVSRDDQGTNFSFGMSIGDNLSMAKVFDTLLDLQSKPSLENETWARIRGSLRQHIGAEQCLFTGVMFGIPCQISRNFVFHSAIEIDTQISFASIEEADLIAEKLSAIENCHASPEVIEFEQFLNLQGVLKTLEKAGLERNPDSSVAREIQHRYNLKWSKVVDHFREARGEMLEKCFIPSMTFELLTKEVSQLWNIIDQRLASRLV